MQTPSADATDWREGGDLRQGQDATLRPSPRSRLRLGRHQTNQPLRTTAAVYPTWARYSVCLYWQFPASARSVLSCAAQHPSLPILTPGLQLATAAASCCGAATCSAVCSMCGKCNNSKNTCASSSRPKTRTHAHSSRHRNPHRICAYPPPQLDPLMAHHDRLGRQEAPGCPP